MSHHDDHIEKRGLGRHFVYDDRAAGYPMRAFMGPEVAEAPAAKTWRRGEILDQGREGACVGFSWVAWRNAEPVPNELTNADAQAAYKRAQQLDEWPGEDYSGTSIQAGAKVMREHKALGTFAWAANPTELSQWVRTYGPVVWACKWRRGSYRTDANGFLQYSGEVVGGHALCCIGVDERGNFIVQNSWGTSFGKSGICYVTPETMQKIYADGQWSACTAIEIPPAQPEPKPEPKSEPVWKRRGYWYEGRGRNLFVKTSANNEFGTGSYVRFGWQENTAVDSDDLIYHQPKTQAARRSN